MATITTLAAVEAATDNSAPYWTDWSRDQLARSINEHLSKASEADTAANDHRIAAGKMLAHVRAHTAPGYFSRWCEQNIKRSRSDIYRCLALVASDDPAEQAKAREHEKQTAREGMQRSRNKQAAMREAGTPSLTLVAPIAEPEAKSAMPDIPDPPDSDKIHLRRLLLACLGDLREQIMCGDKQDKIVRTLADINRLLGKLYA